MDNTDQVLSGRWQMDNTEMIKIGPVGSKNGHEWDEKGRNKIVQIFISHDDEINSIQFQYCENGILILSDSYGQATGCKFDVVKLNHPSEYVTSISGYKRHDNSHLISITFGTNYRTYGPFGGFKGPSVGYQPTGPGKEFIFKLGDDQQFGGFHGTADDNSVKSIGVYLKPKTSPEYSEIDTIGKKDYSRHMDDYAVRPVPKTIRF